MSDQVVTDTEVCSEILKHLATGSTPLNIHPLIRSQNATGGEMTSTDEEIAYTNASQTEHNKELTMALAILLDSTSSGPDPLAIEVLGWAYGLAGMGDWDGCHYLPGPIGRTLRILQDQVAYSITQKQQNKTVMSELAWWEQDHEVEYGEGYERSATRFCTVGGLPPYTIPYTPGGTIWVPPLAGVCVPSRCTALSLYTLFSDPNFGNNLLDLAASPSPVGGWNGEEIFAMDSRRYRYMSALVQSFQAGYQSRMGIVCEGESGLPELDREGYHSKGFYFTFGLVCSLLLCATIGTILKKIERDRYKMKQLEEALSYVEEQEQDSKQAEGEALFDITEEKKTEENFSYPKQSSDEATPMIGSQHDKGVYGTNTSNENLPLLPHLPLSPTNINEVISHQQTHFLQSRKSDMTEPIFISRTEIALKRILRHFDIGSSFNEIMISKKDSLTMDDVFKMEKLRDVSGSVVMEHKWRLAGSSSDFNDCANGKRPMISISSSRCLNGMRSISMLWIIFGHTLAVQSSIGYQNPAALLPPTGMLSSYLGAVILAARYAVDTFFFIGGYLVMSGLLKRLDSKLDLPTRKYDEMSQGWMKSLCRLGIVNPNHVVVGDYVNRLATTGRDMESNRTSFRWFLPFLLHRVLRILPTYGFVLLLWWKVAVALGDGPFWPRWATLVAQCDANAWTNMLFINNLVPRNQPFGETSECMYHAWYLGVDFQLCAILTPLFLTLYLRNGGKYRVQALFLEVLSIILIIIMTILKTFDDSWSGNLFDGSETVSFDRGFYINPFYRSSPYILGFITAQIWHEKCRRCPEVGLTKWSAITLSHLSVIILLVVTFSSMGANDRRPCMVWESPDSTECGSNWSHVHLALYNSLTRPAWGVGLSLLSLLSFNGQLQAFGSSSLLAWSGWDPIARLSFSMYLLHPLVINMWVFSRATKFRYSLVSFLYSFYGIVAATVLLALVTGILVEWPMSKITRDLEKYIWFSQIHQSRKTTVKDENVENAKSTTA